jgi:hypothetical protein
MSEGVGSPRISVKNRCIADTLAWPRRILSAVSKAVSMRFARSQRPMRFKGEGGRKRRERFSRPESPCGYLPGMSYTPFSPSDVVVWRGLEPWFHNRGAREVEG